MYRTVGRPKLSAMYDGANLNHVPTEGFMFQATASYEDVCTSGLTSEGCWILVVDAVILHWSSLLDCRGVTTDSVAVLSKARASDASVATLCLGFPVCGKLGGTGDNVGGVRISS